MVLLFGSQDYKTVILQIGLAFIIYCKYISLLSLYAVNLNLKENVLI